MKRPRALLFDMDGLLLDTEMLHIRAYQRLCARHGKPQKAETLMNFIGHTSLVTTRWLIHDVGIKMDAEVLIREEMSYYGQLLEELRPTPMPGVAEMFALAEQHGLKRALVSSSSHELVDPTMEVLLSHLGKRHPAGQWRVHFDSVCTGDRVKQRKPAPDLYLLAVRELGLQPGECLAFEDSPAGVSAAHAAGVQLIAVPNMYLKDRDVAQNKTKWVFESLADAHAEVRKLFE
ncbi:MAG TPA: HAD family phosphatase [Planctomycetota bacterium]|nr:HAD family phosphatase [Planctomycetota bacterium]